MTPSRREILTTSLSTTPELAASLLILLIRAWPCATRDEPDGVPTETVLTGTFTKVSRSIGLAKAVTARREATKADVSERRTMADVVKGSGSSEAETD
jgi:hypothetical protein